MTRLRRRCSRSLPVATLFLLFLSAGRTAPAQDVERPVSFDSAGRVMTITPPLASRLRLTPPVWPVTGNYVEARILERGDGTFVISVQHSDGSMTRFSLASDQRAQLGRAIANAMTGDRLSTGERLDIISSPAGGQFVRNQTIAGLLVYGPGMATLSENGSTGTALYLLTAGATFFASAAIARSGSITRAQNHLATDGIWRGAAVANALRYVANPESPGGRTNAAVTLGGAMVGSMLSFQFGRHLTDGEANGATFGSTMTAVTTAGIIGTLGGFQGNSQQPEVAALVGATFLGYPLGLRYVRRASYNVTAGDIAALETSALVGVLAGGTILSGGDPSGELLAGFLTAGLIGGIALGDQLLVKPYDFTESQGWLLRLGTVAGGLIGLAVPFAFQVDNAFPYAAAATLGATIGAGVTTRLLSPNEQRRTRR